MVSSIHFPKPSVNRKIQYVLGIDAGGTKSSVCAMDMEGNIIWKYKNGLGLSLSHLGIDELKRRLFKIFEFVKKKFKGKALCICIGLAGAREEKVRRKIKEIIEKMKISNEVIVETDAKIAYYTAFKGEPGIVIIAGTGSIAYGKGKSGEEVRVGGFGHLFGDEGSGLEIGRKALIAVLKQYDGRGIKTSLTNRILKKWRLSSPANILSFVYRKRREPYIFSDLAPIVLQEARKKDKIAKEILREEMNSLSALCKIIIKKLNMKNDVKIVLYGGLFKNALFRNEMKRRMGGKVNIFTPKESPEVGAAQMALKEIYNKK